MDKKVKSLADLVGEILYENCCSGKLCKNCKYDTKKNTLSHSNDY